MTGSTPSSQAAHGRRDEHAQHGALGAVLQTPAAVCEERKLVCQLLDLMQHDETLCHLKKPPKAFFCSITHEAMRNPVCTADGQCYEHSAINRWFESKKSPFTSPLTGQRLPTPRVTPNIALKAAMDEWIDSCGWLDVLVFGSDRDTRFWTVDRKARACKARALCQRARPQKQRRRRCRRS